MAWISEFGGETPYAEDKERIDIGPRIENTIVNGKRRRTERRRGDRDEGGDDDGGEGRGDIVVGEIKYGYFLRRY